MAGDKTNEEKNYISTLTHGGVTYTFEDAEARESIENLADIATSGSWTDLSNTPTTIAGYGITDAYTKSEIDSKVASSFHYKGSKETYSQLPTTGNVTGDVWNIATADTSHGIKAGDNVCWDGTTWDVLAGVTDLTVYDNHIANTSNPHSVTKAQVGLGNVDNTADLDKPISTATQTALNGKVSDVKVGTTSVVNNMVANLGTMAGETASDYSTKAVADTLYADKTTTEAHIANTSNPHAVTKAQVGLGNVDNTSDLNKPISTATQSALDDLSDDISDVSSDLADHIADTTNPHSVTKAQVGLGNVDNTADLDKPISTATQSALDLKADDSDLTAHTSDTSNPHSVTKAQVGLGNVDNTSDADKPISTATQTALNLKADDSDLTAHTSDKTNPHEVTKAQVGLGNVDNTADLDKPISTATQTALDTKVDKTNTANQIYGTAAANTQTTYTISKTATANTVAQRDTDGVLNVGTPTADTNATTKKYVDDADALKVDKVTTASRVYGTDSNGDQTTYDFNALGKVDDVKVAGTSVVTNKIANLGSMASETASNYSTKAVADTLYAAKSLEGDVSDLDTALSQEIQYARDQESALNTKIETEISDRQSAVTSLSNTKADKSTTYTKTEVDGMLSGAMHFKGAVATVADLPTSGNQTGDMYNVTASGANYAWDGTQWVKMAENIDLSAYALSADVTSAIQAEATARQNADALKVDKVTTPNRVYGTDNQGQPITYGTALFGNIDDVTVGGTSVVNNRVAPLGTMAGETASDYYTKAVADTTFAAKSVETTKVDKVSTANRLYGTDANGDQTTYQIQESDTTPTTIGTMAFETATDYYKKTDLANIATSGSWTDLSDTPTTISGYGITDAYTKTEIDGMVASTFHYKGTKTTYSQLPSSGNVIGDVWNIEQADTTHGIKAGDNVCWNGTGWDVLAGVTDLSTYDNHIANTSNPHSVTKAQVGLGNVDNTADLDKPISTATQTALDAKQPTITGAATTITSNNLTANRALISNGSGKVAVSDITSTELGYLDNVTSNVQTQLNAKVAQVSTASRVYGTDSNGDQTTYDFNALGKVDDVKVGTTSVVTNKIANLGTMAGETASNYSTKAVADTLYADIAYENTVDTHIADKTNPHAVTKAQVGLGNVDNTSDANKPVSTAQQTALNAKVDKTNTANQIYGTAAANTQTTYTVSKSATANTIAQRDTDGVLNVGTPTANTNATTKKYVDDADATKVDKVSTASKIYGTDANGDQTTYNVSDVTNTVTDVKVGTSSVVTNKIANLGTMAGETASNYSTKAVADTLYAAKSLETTVSNHTANTSNPHSVTKAQVGLGNVDNTSDANKPVSTAQQTALDAKVDKVSTFNRVYGTDGEGNQTTYSKDSFGKVDDVKVGTTSVVANKIATLGTMAGETASNYYTKSVADTTFAAKSLETTVSNHIADKTNPHAVTKAQVGLGNVDNTSDADKPISTATQSALDNKVTKLSTASKVYGTDSTGAQTSYNVSDLTNTVTDVKVGTTSVVTNKIANLGTMAGETASNYYTKSVADTTFAAKSVETTVANKVDKVTTASKVYGTDASGNQTTYDYTALGKVDDVKVGTTSVVSNKIATLGTMAGETASNYSTKAVADTLYAAKSVETTVANKVDKVTTASKLYGTSSNGTQTTYSVSDFENDVTDVKVGTTSVVSNKIATLGTMAGQNTTSYYTKSETDDLIEDFASVIIRDWSV